MEPKRLMCVQRSRNVALLGALALIVGMTGGASGEELRVAGKAFASGAYRIAGYPLSCGGVRTLVSPELADFGASVGGTIVINPDRLARLPLTTRLFIYAHECGHQRFGRSEAAADCYAAERGRREGWLRADAIRGMCGVFPRTASSNRHGARGDRCALIRACFAGVVSARQFIRASTYSAAVSRFASAEDAR